MSDTAGPTIETVAGDRTDCSELWTAFRDAADPEHPEFELLAGLCSMMLNPDGGDGGRFAPMVVFGDGSTTFTAAQLTGADITLLKDLEIENTALRARVSDVLWEVLSGRERVDHVHRAIDGYITLGAALDGYEAEEILGRAIDLAIRFKRSDEGARLAQLHELLSRTVPTAASSPADLLSTVGLLRRVGPKLSDRDDVVPLLIAAKDAAAAHEFGIARECIVELQYWTEDEEARHGLSAEAADLWIAEADGRLQGPKASSFVAASFLESAIQLLRSIPRKHRARFDVERRVTALRIRMADLNEAALDEMVAIDSPEFSLRDAAQKVQGHVAGLTTDQALLRFTLLAPWMSEADERKDAEQALKGRLVIPATTITRDGRVADKADISDAVESEMGRRASLRRTLITLGLLIPALQVLRAEHTLTRADFSRLAYASALVPPGQERLFAAGLSAGWNHDFGVAIHVLAPRLEATVRYHLKRVGVITTTLQDGIDTELSLPALLDKAEAAEVFGVNAIYELQGIFAGRFGSNLRHEVAHGLVDDSISSSVTAVYAWWTIFRLFMTPFWNQMDAANASTEGPADVPTERTG